MVRALSRLTGRPTWPRLASGAAATAILLAAWPAGHAGRDLSACGPFPLYPLFTPAHEPDDPRFFSGDLGILQPTYRQRYLVAAWRALNGRPLTARERLAYEPQPIRATPPPISATPPVQPVSAWLSARMPVRAGQVSNDIRQETFVEPTYSYVLNCGDSAFLTAAATLEARKAALGASSPEFVQWVLAQDQVFRNCGRMPNQPAAIPDALGPDASAAARADRAYQIAAAELYAGRFVDAEAAFTAIEADAHSPWRHMAPYLAARAMIRQGTLGGSDGAGDPSALARARRALEDIARDPALEALHGPAQGLLGFVRAHTEPTAALADVARALSRPDETDRFAGHLQDFGILMDHVARAESNPEAGGGLAPARESSDLVDWIAAFQAGDGGLAHALERWDRTGATSWLLVALAELPPGHPRQEALVRSAAATGSDSPAYPTLAFHRARLLMAAGEPGRARDALDQGLAAPRLPVSAVNLLKAARLLTDRTLDEFLTDAVRTPIGDTSSFAEAESVGRPGARTFDRDAIDVINERMPLALLGRLGADGRIPPAERTEITLAAFTRAILLRDATVTRAILPEVSRVAPDLGPALAPLESSRDADTLIAEGALVLLDRPGLRPFVPAGSFRSQEALASIDSLRDNWWCGFESAGTEVVPYETQYWHRGNARFDAIQLAFRTDPNQLPALPFLSDEERARAAGEWQTLQRTEAGPVALGRRALAWADGHPDDPRVPQVLYQVVRATRYGCDDEKTGEVSQAAFSRLHTRYGSSRWAARTPYWFK